MIICGDALTELRKLPDESVNCCITSPPYWGLRDYGVTGQLGLERTPEEYISKLVEVFREVRRVLKNNGTLWMVMGDSYAGSWGNSGHRPEIDNSPSYQRKKKTEYINRRGWNSRREIPPNQNPPGLKPKDLVGIPWRVAFALQADGWWLRQDIIWAKPNPMPESVTDRCTRAHEYIFMLAKSARYYYDQEAIKESAIYFDDDRIGRAQENHKRMPSDLVSGIRPRKIVYKDARSYDGKHSDKQRGHGRRHAGFNDRWDKRSNKEQYSALRNKRSVWTIATKPFKEAHFAIFPPDLVEPMIKAGCPLGGVVLDPFFGAGTTGMVSKRLGRDFIGIELNPVYIKMAERRIAQVGYQMEIGA